MTDLLISDGGGLPVEYVTKTAAILAQRRKGKTYTASVLAEELYAAGQPWVALDPTGAWWGMRAAADGEGPGLPVVIIGGQHGDIPLERTGGRLVADLVVDHPGWYVIDLSLLDSKAAERQVATDFADRLYRRKGQAGMDFPLHLFVDEADMFVPQDRDSGDAAMLGAFQAIVRRGGIRGLGTTLISQRAALVNKSVLEQLDMLVLLRTVGPNDRKAVEGYVRAHGTDKQKAELLGSLASLALGEAWLWEPGAEPPLFARVKVRARRTFNSSATPRPGERRVEPRLLADVDLAAITAAMADTIEKAKADDPKELRKQLGERDRRIADLERALAERPAVEPEVVEVHVLGEKGHEAIALLVEHLGRVERSVTSATEGILGALGRVDVDGQAGRVDVPRARGAGDGARAVADRDGGGRTEERPDPPARRDAGRSAVPRSAPPARGGGDLPAGEAKILTAIAQHRDGVTREQLTVLTGYKRSSRDTYLQRLRTRELIEITGQHIHATAAGVDALGDDFEPLPTGAALRDHWLASLPEGERRILAELIAAYPAGVPRDELSEVTGYKRSSRDTYLQRLRSRQLVTTVGGEPRAADVLFEEV